MKFIVSNSSNTLSFTPFDLRYKQRLNLPKKKKLKHHQQWKNYLRARNKALYNCALLRDSKIQKKIDSINCVDKIACACSLLNSAVWYIVCISVL